MIENVKLSLTIDSGNAAMVDEPQCELIRILGDVSARISRGEEIASIRDVNGNKVGQWQLDLTEGDDDDQ